MRAARLPFNRPQGLLQTIAPALLLAGLLVVAPGHASSKKAVGELDYAGFMENKAHIEEELRSGDLYREIKDSDRTEVLAALNRMAALLEGVTHASQLLPERRVQLFNDQQRVNTLLTAARDDSRLVCSRQGTVGTHFKATRCETVAKRRERVRTAQDLVREYALSKMKPPIEPSGGF